MADAKRRIALKPHIDKIREWVDAGKDDDWIADALGTSASSVQSFRSRNDIYRREPVAREPTSIFEGVLDHGEEDGYGMWLDPSVAEDPIWREHWTAVNAVTVKIAQDSIVLERTGDGGDGDAIIAALAGAAGAPVANGFAEDSPDGSAGGGSSSEGASELPGLPVRERGKVKWFDPDKGYGFIIRSSDDDLFVHQSEVQGEASELQPGRTVEYEVSRNDRGLFARKVQLFDS